MCFKLSHLAVAVLSVALVFIAAAPAASSQAAPTPRAGVTPERMTNAEVLRLLKERRSEAEIVRNIKSAIQSGTAAFDLSPNALIGLHQAGASNNVLNAMMGDGSVRPGAPNANLGGKDPGPMQKSADGLNPQPLPPNSRLLSPSAAGPSLDPAKAANTIGGATMLPAGPAPVTGSAKSASTAGANGTQRSIGGTGAYTGTTKTVEKNPGPTGFTGAVKSALPAPFTGGVRIVAGGRSTNSLATNSSIIAVFRQQKTGGTVTPGHALSSGSISPSRLPEPNVRVQAASSYVPSSLLTAQENASCQAREAQSLAPEIYYVDGKSAGQGVVYSPDSQANPYTIVGCGFGDQTGAVNLLFLSAEGKAADTPKPVYTLSLMVKGWSDHQIILSLDPSTSHLPDWNHAVLQVRSPKAIVTSPGVGTFYAFRQTVLLASIPQNEASLYQQGSPYFLSPLSNYYGLDGTVGIMRQGLPANAVAAQDHFNLQLAPGFVVDSTQTDLLVANTTANVTSQSASVSGNTVTVTYPVFSSGSGSSTNYYSIYGLKIWVSGPVGVAPVVPAP